MALKYNMKNTLFQVWERAMDGTPVIADEYIFQHLIDAEKRKEELEQLTDYSYKIVSIPLISKVEETNEYEW